MLSSFAVLTRDRRRVETHHHTKIWLEFFIKWKVLHRLKIWQEHWLYPTLKHVQWYFTHTHTHTHTHTLKSSRLELENTPTASLQKGKTSRIGTLGDTKYLFIAIAVRPTLARSGSTWKGLSYRSNRTVGRLYWVQTNDLCYTELLEIEPFDHLTVCKQMTDV